jgi:hypothetical protein
MDDLLEGEWEKEVWIISRYYSGIQLEGLTKNTKILSQDSRWSNQVSK